MINHDNHAKNSGFDMLRANMDAQFASLRAEMSEHFNKVYVLIEELQRARPASAKGKYIKKVGVSSTMGPGVKIDISAF